MIVDDLILFGGLSLIWFSWLIQFEVEQLCSLCFFFWSYREFESTYGKIVF